MEVGSLTAVIIMEHGKWRLYMRAGKIVLRDDQNDHLDSEPWIEIFPDGMNPKEIMLLHGLARENKSYNKEPYRTGQSPMLIRKKIYDLL
jgi:hypothetical protein